MAGSHLVPLKRAVVTRLQGSTRLGGVQISYAFPGRNLRRDCLYAGAGAFDQEYLPTDSLTAPRRPRSETATVDLHIRVYGVGRSAEQVDRRADEILTVVDETFADDITLDEAASSFRYVGVKSGRLTEAGTDDARAALLTLTLTFRSAFIQ